MTVYMIRHGQTLWNKDMLWQGQTDVELNEAGLAQAGRVALHLKNRGITKLYSSPLKRAQATAKAIGEELSLQPFFREDLKEVALGEWEGLSFVQVRERYAEYLRVWENEPEREVGLGIENYACLRDRAVNAMFEICKSHNKDDVIAIVTHGAWLRAFLLYVLGIRMDSRLCFELENTGVSIVKYDADRNRFWVSTLNEHGHVVK